MKFLFLILTFFSCSKKHDPFIPKVNEWMHYKTELFSQEENKVFYKFTFRFQKKNSGVFFLEINSYGRKKGKEAKTQLYQTQIFGEMEIDKNKLNLKYTDSVVNHRYCDWVLSQVGKKESIPFFFNKEENTIETVVLGEERFLYDWKKKKLPKEYIEIPASLNEEDCSYFKELLGKKDGFF